SFALLIILFLLVEPVARGSALSPWLFTGFNPIFQVRSARSGFVPLTIFPVAVTYASSVGTTVMNMRGRNTLSGQAQSNELEQARRLSEEARRLSRKGQYDKAIPLAKRALAIYERELGPDHFDVADPLYFLADLYYKRKNYAKAKPLYQRAMEIRDKAFGSFLSFAKTSPAFSFNN